MELCKDNLPPRLVRGIATSGWNGKEFNGVWKEVPEQRSRVDLRWMEAGI